MSNQSSNNGGTQNPWEDAAIVTCVIIGAAIAIAIVYYIVIPFIFNVVLPVLVFLAIVYLVFSWITSSEGEDSDVASGDTDKTTQTSQYLSIPTPTNTRLGSDSTSNLGDIPFYCDRCSIGFNYPMAMIPNGKSLISVRDNMYYICPRCGKEKKATRSIVGGRMKLEDKS